MGEWLIAIGAATHLTASALMFGDLMDLRSKRDDPEAVAGLLRRGVVGNRWVRLVVQLLVVAGLVLITVGLVVGD